MVEAIPSLKPRVIGEVASADKKFSKWMYYRLPDNSITLAPAHPMEQAKRVERGQRPLKQYGQFEYDKREVDANGQSWNVRHEPYRLLFQRGGEKEFSIDQIIAHRWHLRPPYQEVTFPQLEGVFWESYECPDCEKAVFTSLDEGYAPQEMISHLRLGHGWTRAEVAEYAREVGIKFRRGRRGSKPPSIQEEVKAEPQEAKRNEEFRCECGWAPLKDAKRPDVSLRWHKKKCKVALSEGALKE